MQVRSLITVPLVGAALGAASAFAAAWYASHRINPTPRRSYRDAFTLTPWELGIPFETVVLTTPDGLNLHAWWLPQPTSEQVIIGCHGHTGGKHELLGISSRLWQAGFNVFLFDLRGRGQSDPFPNTLAGYELVDLETALAYVRQRAPTASIGLLGYSMGGVLSILLAAAHPQIHAVVADSSYSNAELVVANKMRKIVAGLAYPLLAITSLVIAQRYGYTLGAVRPSEAVARIAPRPLLLIHGTADSLVPVEHAEHLFAAAGEPKELWLVPDADHCGAYFLDRETYVARVRAFFGHALQAIDTSQSAHAH